MARDTNVAIAGEDRWEDFDRSKIPIALGILAGALGLAALEVLGLLMSALTGVAAMFFTGILTPEEAYEAVGWEVIFMVAGVIPLGIAVEASGTADLIADFVVSVSVLLPVIAVLGLFRSVLSTDSYAAGPLPSPSRDNERDSSICTRWWVTPRHHVRGIRGRGVRIRVPVKTHSSIEESSVQSRYSQYGNSFTRTLAVFFMRCRGGVRDMGHDRRSVLSLVASTGALALIPSRTARGRSRRASASEIEHRSADRSELPHPTARLTARA
ncbi:SLC13 family permease [Halogranum amylolyticum]|nr:SLC13 family permease [Halogranum amylolyticum]